MIGPEDDDKMGVTTWVGAIVGVLAIVLAVVLAAGQLRTMGH